MSERGVELHSRLLQLTARVQNYHWGKPGDRSLVAQLCGQSDAALPYAELWVGAHPKAPSTVRTAGGETSLEKIIAANPAAIVGERSVREFGPRLPFLFKVLSIDRALSIQAHPDKGLAAALHARAPDRYFDDNHKPEFALAISDVDLLYGFQTLEGVRQALREYPELGELLSAATRTDLTSAEGQERAAAVVRAAYSEIVSAASNFRRSVAEALIARLGRERGDLSRRARYLLQFHAEYGPDDIGILSSLLMNLITLAPGQAIFIGPNIPHAYLRGELVECMANSDNVVRAGLTPKFQDIPTLVEMLNYAPEEPSPLKREKSSSAPFWVYPTPAREFRVESLEGSHQLEISNDGGLKLIFCLAGSGTIAIDNESLALEPGGAVFVPAAEPRYRLSCRDAKIFRISVP